MVVRDPVPFRGSMQVVASRSRQLSTIPPTVAGMSGPFMRTEQSLRLVAKSGRWPSPVRQGCQWTLASLRIKRGAPGIDEDGDGFSLLVLLSFSDQASTRVQHGSVGPTPAQAPENRKQHIDRTDPLRSSS